MSCCLLLCLQRVEQLKAFKKEVHEQKDFHEDEIKRHEVCAVCSKAWL